MSRLTVQIGHGAITEHDQLRHARQAVAPARAGHHVIGSKTTPMPAALLHVVEARGHALLGDANTTRASVLEAERHDERARLDDEPAWLSFYTEAESAADLGRCLRDIGDSDQTTRLITQAMNDYEPWRIRSRCFVQTDLAAAHLGSGDYEQAASLGRAAVRTAAQVSSTRTLDRLRTLQRRVKALPARSTHLGDLDARVTELLAGNRARPDESTAT